MKKNIRQEKALSVPTQVELDMAVLLNKIQQQLTFLEKKIDVLIGNSSQRPPESKPFPGPFQQAGRANSYGQGRQDNNYRERVLHKAICADCRKECEVPFKPAGDRPVYCKDCFSARRKGGSFTGAGGNRPREERPAREHHFDKKHRAAHRGSGPKKKTSFRKRRSK